MKKSLLLLFVVSFIAFSSCEKIKDIADVSFDVTIKKEIQESLKGTGVEGQDVISLSVLNEDVKPYKDNLKKIEIKEFYVNVKDFSGTTEDFFVKLSTSETLLLDQQLNLKSLLQNATPVKVENAEYLAKLSNQLLNNESVLVNYLAKPVQSGTINTNFKLEVVVKVKVTANPL